VRHAGVVWARQVAYFSAEFGLHESLPIYSGGLGILAGDHIKSAADLGIPLVGVGLCYDQGYFRQWPDRNGWQHEDYIDVDHRLLPIRPAFCDGVPVMVSIETRTGRLAARVWQLSLGRNTLLLLDSNVDGNQPEDRELTAHVYGGDQRVRAPAKAFSLCSLAIDFRIAEAVDGTQVLVGSVPKSLFPKR